MTGPDFENFCRLVQLRSGLVLGADKAYLVKSRLDPIAIKHGMADASVLMTVLRERPTESLIRICVDAMATHESLFFRDGSPFQQLSDLVLPDLLKARAPDHALRVWSAACSSGQEPYSIAMLLMEQSARLAGRRVQIVATDMAQAIVEKARAGLYSEFEVQRGLTPERRDRWMLRRGGGWEMRPELKAMVTFQKHNLLDGVTGLGTFDIVFCRNVLIYFDQAGKRRVLGQIAQAMAPDAALFLGSAENVLGLSEQLELMRGSRGIYRPIGLAQPAARTA